MFIAALFEIMVFSTRILKEINMQAYEQGTTQKTWNLNMCLYIHVHSTIVHITQTVNANTEEWRDM